MLVQTLETWMKSYSVNIQLKAIEQCFPVVLCVMLQVKSGTMCCAAGGVSFSQGSYGSWKSWKVLGFYSGIFQDWN